MSDNKMEEEFETRAVVDWKRKTRNKSSNGLEKKDQKQEW